MSGSRRPTDHRFHGELLQALRKDLGWTQETLSRKSGLSVRVIAKAEKGDSVANSTIEAIAKSLKGAGLAISSTDFVVNPETLTRHFISNYGRYESDCVEHSRHLLSPGVVAHVDGDLTSNPIAGTYTGIEEFDRLWKKFFAIFVRDGGTLVDAPVIRCLGQEVVVWGYESLRVREAPPHAPWFVMFRLQFEDNRVVRFENYYDVTGMTQALRKWIVEYPDAPWLQHINVEAMRPS